MPADPRGGSGGMFRGSPAGTRSKWRIHGHQTKGDRIIVMVKIAVPPDASWKRFAVAMKGLFATYEQARKKLERSQYTSELSSDSDGPQGKRMWRPPSQWSQSDEEPVRHKPTKAAPRKVPAVPADFPQAFKQHVLRLLNIMRFTLQQHGEMLNKLCAILPVQSVIAHPSLVEQAFNTLPDLLAFEKELDEEKALRLVHELKQLGGKTASKATKRMLTYLLTDELAAQFSWIGRKGKLNFSVLKTATAITDAAKKLPGGKDAIEDSIKSWLRHAPERAKGQSSTTSATISLGFAPIGIATDFPPALPPARKTQAATMPNSADNAMEYDALSGRTLAPPGPWQQILRERRHLKNPPANPPRPSEPRQSTNRPPGTPAPRLPDSDYKVVFRPRTGLRVAAWNDRQLAQSLQRASKIPEYIFYARVTVQIQASQNLIVAGTPEENCALALSEISTIQLGAATHEVLPYLKPLPGTRRGVIHGLDPDTTTDQLPHILAYNGARILHARMLGNSTSAVVTFEGIHVPFYIKAYGLFTRCRPYRQTVQCCSLCGELGHRQDVCPNPDTIMCAQCHTRDPTQDHDCTPKCQLCGLAHPTASKDCRKKLRSPPPPLRDRERALTSQRWQQQSSSNSQPPEQRQFPPNQPNQRQWKHADITLIPKPGKPLNPKNLRPISLTSCVGKLFEHMVHNRLSPHIEDKDYFPDTMYGFRPHLSTQDILLQLKEEVLDSLNNHSKRSILTLDIKGAFDNISHQAILQGVASTNCGERTYKYFASFLTNRTATVTEGTKVLPKSSRRNLRPSRGPPEGSRGSPEVLPRSSRKNPRILPRSSGEGGLAVTPTPTPLRPETGA
ncbi:hypothetical protein ISCGN_027308 [Ixodes scapularis]